MHWKLDNYQEDIIIIILSSVRTFMQIMTQCNLKDKISAYPCARIHLVSLYLVLLQSKRSYSKLLKKHFLVSYDALNGYFVEQCVLP
jgi:hypothetical protein